MDVINDNCPTYVVGNFNPSQLDLIYTKNKNDIKQFGHFPAVGVSNHHATYTIINTFTTKREHKTYTFRNFSNIDNEKT